MTREDKLAAYQRNDPDLYAFYITLPAWEEGMTVRCPTRNMDGTECDPDDVPGCGSKEVSWGGDAYDCHECGIFFGSYAADPPHQRDDDTG